MKQRRRRLKISGDQSSLLRTEEHKEEEECRVECLEVEWEECPTWETLEEHHHQTAEILRDQRLMKWTKRGNEWNIVFCKSYFLKNDTDDEIMPRTFFEDFALRNVTVRFS